jgi:hypothetical protein
MANQSYEQGGYLHYPWSSSNWPECLKYLNNFLLPNTLAAHPSSNVARMHFLEVCCLYPRNKVADVTNSCTFAL